MYETIHEQLRDRFYQDPEIIKMIAEVEKKVLANEISSFAGAKILLDQYATKS
jgi:LAO/AO transport system kinase